MVQFSIPVKSESNSRRFFNFAVRENAVMFAGSRFGLVPNSVCTQLVEQFSKLGFGFFVGCANGVDDCFRKAISETDAVTKSFVACAYMHRLERSYGIFASVVVPFEVSPKAALVRRSLWMVKRSSMVVLFPDNPKTLSWGKGSTIVFNAAVSQIKPVFVVTKNPPKQSSLYKIIPSNFQGIVSGFWCVPHPTQDGTVDDE